MNLNLKNTVKISKALADENRYKIFKTIADKGEIVCKKITDLFPLSQPTISHHLKILLECNLIEARKEGQWSYFSINHTVFNDYIASVSETISG